jgi:hypothetical protein
LPEEAEARFTVREITWEEYERFEPERRRRGRERKSPVRELLERVVAGGRPVEVSGLARGQILALLSQVTRYNRNATGTRIVYKCDVKRGIVLLAPVKEEQALVKEEQGEG